jgi:hypothetical protein
MRRRICPVARFQFALQKTPQPPRRQRLGPHHRNKSGDQLLVSIGGTRRSISAGSLWLELGEAVSSTVPEPAPRGSGTESWPRCLTPGGAYSGGELRASGRLSREISDECFGAVCDGHSDSDFAWLHHGGLFVSPFPRDAILSLFLDGPVFCFRHGSHVWLRHCVPNCNHPMVVTIAGYTILQGHRAMGVKRSRHMACVLAPARLLVDCFRSRSDRRLLGSIQKGPHGGLVNVGPPETPEFSHPLFALACARYHPRARRADIS